MDWSGMSSSDGIANSGGTWGSVVTTATPSTAASTPTAQQPRTGLDLGGIFARSFNRSLDTIFVRAQPQTFADLDTPGHSLGQAVPQAAAFLAAVDQRRELVDQRLATSVSRLMDVAAKLDEEYPLAEVLAPASTGTWDPATFRPRNEAEAQAFAQRMAIDMTEAAARLDIVKNELDGARLDAQASNTGAARAKVQELTQDVSRQMEYLSKLASIVDGASEGSVADVGAEALSGSTLRASADVSTRELAREMQSMGFDSAEIERMLGAGEVSVEEQKAPGGSSRLRQIDQKMGQKFVANFLLNMWDDSAKTRRDDDRAREQRQAIRDARAAKQRTEQQIRRREAVEAQHVEAAAEQQAALRSYLQQRARPA